METIQLTVRDETSFGNINNELVLEFFTRRITVRTLIRERVRQEVERFNAEKADVFNGLVQPTNTEKTLNGFRFRQNNRKDIDWETQADNAEDAFLSNGFILLVDDKQRMDLDETLELLPTSTVTFFKLVQLVGG